MFFFNTVLVPLECRLPAIVPVKSLGTGRIDYPGWQCAE